ncbi:hypothetical protein Tco_1261475 [Tanacetum coccineum]
MVVVSSPVVDESVVAVENTKDVNVGQTPISSTVDMISGTFNAKLFTGESSMKRVNFGTLITPVGNKNDVVVPLESITAVSECSIYGLDSMLENGPWFIRNNPLILKKSNLDVNLLKEDVVNVPADVELKDTIMMAMRKLVEEEFYTCNIRVEYEWKPHKCACCKVFGHVQCDCPKKICSDVAKNLKNSSQAPKGVPVGPKLGFKPVKQVFRPVFKKNNVNTSGNKKKESLEKGKEANSSGSSFWNVGSSIIITTPIVEKINKSEKLIIDKKITLVDDEGKPLENIDYLGDHDSEDEVEQVDYDIYNDDMYEGYEIPDNIQSICDNLDIS